MPNSLVSSASLTPRDRELMRLYLANNPQYDPAQTLPGTDEEKITALLASKGASMLPYEYRGDPGPRPTLEQLAGLTARPATPPPGTSYMRPELARALLADQPGVQAELPPTGIGDLIMNPVMSFLEEADLSSLLPAGLVGLAAALPLKRGRVRPLTAKSVLAEAATKKSGFPAYATWRAANPTAGSELFDFSNLQPAIPNLPELPVYTPKAGPPARVTEAMTNPEVRETLKSLVSRGMDIAPKPWYRTQPLYKIFQEEWGDAAEQEFLKYMQRIAGTSPGMTVPNNVRTGSYYWYLLNQGLPVPAEYVTKVNPRTGTESQILKATPAAGYGSKTQALHAANELDLRAGGIDPLQRPKNPRFASNLSGGEQDVTIDTHNMRAIGMAARDPRFLATRVETEITVPTRGGKTKKKKIYINPQQMLAQGKITMDEALQNPTWWESVPRKTEYGYLQEQQRGLAKEMEPVAQAKLGRPLMPAEWQDKLWVGAGGKSDIFPGTGLESPPEAWLETLAARVAYTAQRMGADPREVLRLHVRGKIPLLGIPAAGYFATQSDEQPPPAPRGQF